MGEEGGGEEEEGEKEEGEEGQEQKEREDEEKEEKETEKIDSSCPNNLETRENKSKSIDEDSSSSIPSSLFSKFYHGFKGVKNKIFKPNNNNNNNDNHNQ